MTDAIVARIDDMGERIDELEKRYVYDISDFSIYP